jgi:hypothetical protein
MANEALKKFLSDKVAGFQAIQDKLTQLEDQTTDLDSLDDIRMQRSSDRDTLFALQSALNSVDAAENEIPPPPDDQVRVVADALTQLDAFVVGDQDVHAVLGFLQGVANQIGQAQASAAE